MNDTRRAVLEAIEDGPVPGPALADRLGVSRNAVWKHVEELRDAGFEIASDDEGYVLEAVPGYGGPAVEFGLDAPFEVKFHDAVESTNDRARELADDGAADVVVLADEQTVGRGRLDREWSAPSGGVWLSIVLQPDLPTAHVPALTLAAAVATTDAAREAGVPAEIKWPNDVLVEASEENDRGGAKLAGILTEMEGEADRVSWVVIGIGVNANVPPEALPEDATSIQTEVGAIDRRIFVQRLLERFDDLRRDLEEAVEAWRDRAATLGQRVRVDTPNGEVVGEAVDVVFPGALVVETGVASETQREDGEAVDDGERVRIHAGDCEHVRPV